MCNISSVRWGLGGPAAEEKQFAGGVELMLNKHGKVNNIFTMPLKVKCVHVDGRTDNYTLQPGQALEVDEDGTKLEITNPVEISEAWEKHRKEQVEKFAAFGLKI